MIILFKRLLVVFQTFNGQLHILTALISFVAEPLIVLSIEISVKHNEYNSVFKRLAINFLFKIKQWISFPSQFTIQAPGF